MEKTMTYFLSELLWLNNTFLIYRGDTQLHDLSYDRVDNKKTSSVIILVIDESCFDTLV